MPRMPRDQFDFDEWARLAARDPEAFEARRAACVERLIANAPRERQERLRRLQWRIDRTRECAPNPVAACMRISKMMWESVLGDGGLLNALKGARHGKPPPRAAVLPFRRGGDSSALKQ
jgi:hypothetical protein